MLLAEQGAEVLRVEPPSRDRLHATAGYHVFNRSKRLLLADIHQHQDRAHVLQLAAQADVVIVDLPAPDAERLGLDHTTLSSGRQYLVSLAMPPYGSQGPLAGEDADESLVAAYAGLSAHFRTSQPPSGRVRPDYGRGRRGVSYCARRNVRPTGARRARG
jgi:crotonobetainyl-CoA:carnitine CoA-transferase CaiB-like acyl-CoA transferase